ncbi:hypothetical protein [Streptomyces sp. NPDC001970]
MFHADDTETEHWTESQTVFVHLSTWDAHQERARWLAARIGREVLGEPQIGW